MDKTVMGSILKDLRQHKGITQKELALQIGVSLPAIKNYESGAREPNSKAMVALEKYFHVSGEFLRGEIERESFYKKSASIQYNLDDTIELFISFKSEFSIASQDNQLVAAHLLNSCIREITQKILTGDAVHTLNVDELISVFNCFLSINDNGRAELVKRSQELMMLPNYSKGANE